MKRKYYIEFLGRRIGFTLTELLIVFVIIAILATLALPMLIKTIEKAKVGEAISNLNLIRTGQKIYFLENRNFSSGIDVLNIENPNDTTNRYFYYEITSDYNPDDFTATATRGGSGAQPAPGLTDGDVYTVGKDGTITGPLL